MKPDDDRSVHVVDDDPGMRRSLEIVLAASGLDVTCHATGESFLSALKRQRVGCVVLDLRMEPLGGLELLERMQRGHEPPPAILLTGHGAVEEAVRAMKLGAFDFLEKPADPRVLVRRVREALAKHGTERIRGAERRAIQARLERLSPAEREVLDHLARGRSSAQIASALHRSRRTVENHRLRILRKMEAGSATELVRMVILAERV